MPDHPSEPIPGSGAALESIDRLGSGQTLTQDELVELIGAFNGVTAQLQQTHARLVGEVSRLRGELRQKNEQLERSRRLAALGEMAAGIAHEVRNPLGSIGLYAEMLRDDLAGMPEQAATAIKIREAVLGLNAIVGDVLHLAREMPVRAVECDPESLVSRAIDACAAELVGVETSVEAGEQFEADPDLLHRALLNLIRNAAEAMAASDRPALHLRAGVDLESREAVVSVRDAGEGVSPEVQDRMFNPFFTTRDAGTGLGLAIVHRIAEAHGGTVSIWNNTEREGGAAGATAELRFPARQPRGSGSGTSAYEGV